MSAYDPKRTSPFIGALAPMQNEISFYSDELGRKFPAFIRPSAALLTVTTPDGGQKNFAIGIIKFARNSGAHNAD
jgi:hypothetical protein